MPITSSAGLVQLVRDQTDYRETPPIFFTGIYGHEPYPTPERWSFCIWVKQRSTIPHPTLVGFYCQMGSYIRIINDGRIWQLQGRDITVALPTTNLDYIQYNKWQVICFTKNGAGVSVYMGTERPLEENPHQYPVALTLVAEVAYPGINDPFIGLNLNIFNFTDVCCFKYWNNDILTKEQFEYQANRWDASAALGPAPIWVAPLRTAGDLGNIANPDASDHWDYEHMWRMVNRENIITGGSIGAWNDPAYMSNSTPCPTWVYPAPFGVVDPHVFVDPGMTPLNPTDYKGTQFYQFEDRGAIPANDAAVSSIKYYGHFFSGPDAGIPASDAYGLYRDHNGAEVFVGGASNSFIQTGNNGLTIPGPITATNMYRWQFGGFFTWNPITPQQETATANVKNLMLYVTYTGYPTGRALLPKDDLSGLFVVYKAEDRRNDIYNNNVILRLPDPTIRTAYIGE